jgi:hypothetical protein
MRIAGLNGSNSPVEKSSNRGSNFLLNALNHDGKPMLSTVETTIRREGPRVVKKAWVRQTKFYLPPK